MKIIECPRDAMQGLLDFVPTELKVRYINQILKVGFDTVDFGSFVSPKAIPQMHDTAEVLEGLELSGSRSKLLAIVANVKGAELASDYEEIQYLGYPLSLSETFQKRNTNRSIGVAFDNLAEIQDICQSDDKTLVVYLSMGFGNPYGDPYEVDYVGQFVDRLDKMEVDVVSLADTIGVSNTETIEPLFQTLIPKFPHIEFGAHFHSNPNNAVEKIKAAYKSGCRRMDGAIRGYGGCPMAKDELVGNMATETILSTLKQLDSEQAYDQVEFFRAIELSKEIFI
ncbi:MAG: hydroxymethylglutaryl-CoA lyase [Marinoscillum sp.]